jgi:hypothetical protein
MTNPLEARGLPHPATPATLRLVETYGEAPMTPRCRYDDEAMTRHPTAKLAADESRRIPKRCVSDPAREAGPRIGHEETALRARVRGVDAR